MFRAGALIIAAAFVAGAATIPNPPASKGPTPSGPVAANPQQQKTGGNPQPPDQRGTQDVPLIVRLLDPPNADKIAAENEADRQERTSNDERIQIFNLLLVFVGFGQGGVLLYTAVVANKAANAAKSSADAVVSQLRAYVSMRVKEGVPPRFDPIRGPYCAFEVKNMGQTPAFNMNHWNHAAIGPLGHAGPFTVEQLEPEPMTLAPGNSIDIATEGPEPQGDDAQRFAAGQLAVYVWGEITYTDAFGNPRFHKYRYTFTAQDLAGPHVQVRMCPGGNEAN